MSSVSIRWPFLLTFWSGSSEVSIYTPVVGKPYPVFAGMMAEEPSRPLLALAALTALQKNPDWFEYMEEKRPWSFCFSAQL